MAELMRNPSHKFISLAWPAALLALCCIAALPRFVALDYNLPEEVGSDDYFSHVWARAVRETGYPNVDHGSGYPPGILYLLAADQIVVEIIKGPNINKGIDYFLGGRTLCAFFGVAAAVAAAHLGKVVGKSQLAGLAAGAFVALDQLIVGESRRAAANAPWLFFTLLVFVFLFKARDTHQISLLYFSLIAGVISFLFRYQSGLILILPFIYGLVYFREKPKRLLLHEIVWGLSLVLLLAWLLLDYKILEIVNTPNSDTGSIVQSGRLVGFQSVNVNLDFAISLVGVPLFVALAGIVAYAAYLAFRQQKSDLVDAAAVLTFVVFGLLFFLLMSLFKPVAISKWTAFVGAEYVLAAAGLVAGLRGLGLLAARLASRPTLATLVPLAGIIGLSFPFGFRQTSFWVEMYTNVWSKPPSMKILNTWFHQHVPQGGRLVTEAQKVLPGYIYEPHIYHNGLTGSIFQESVSSYRERGYDYLIWNDLKSSPTDALADLDARQSELKGQGAEEVLRLAGDDYTGPIIVVFQLDPLPENELYAWFSPAISFRGYDLNRDSFRPGDEVDLTLYWESAEVVKNNYIVFIHILDLQTGYLAAGQDGPPDNSLTPTWKWQGDMQFIRDQRTLVIPADAKPGTYTLRIGMYDADTKARVMVLDLKNQPIGDTLVLQEVEIEN